jgi:hypothetical protein
VPESSHASGGLHSVSVSVPELRAIYLTFPVAHSRPPPRGAPAPRRLSTTPYSRAAPARGGGALSLSESTAVTCQLSSASTRVQHAGALAAKSHFGVKSAKA